MGVYSVAANDNLWNITKNYFNGSLSNSEINDKVNELAQFNNIKDTSKIYVGQEIDLSCFGEIEDVDNQRDTETNEANKTKKETSREDDILDSEFDLFYDNDNPYYDEDDNITIKTKFFKSDNNGELSGMTVMVNSGHGGYNPVTGYFDPGAINKDYDIEEWQINIDYAKELTQKLLDEGANVVLTQGHAKIMPDAIGEFADEYGDNKDNNNLKVISLHCDSGYKNQSGIVYLYSDGNNSLSNLLLNAAQEQELNIKYTSDTELKICEASNEYNIDSALVEMGFMSNPKELDMLLNDDEYKEDFINSIIEGLIKSNE